MTTEQIIGLSLALLLMLVGFVGSILPGLPGTPLVLIAAIGHRLYFGPESVGPLVLGVLIALTLITLVLDYVASYYGAKTFGATWRGGVGAAIGGLIGIFFGIPGILLGPFLGATLFELIGGHEFQKAAKAGAGATLGLFAGAIGKCAVCVVMIGLFTVNVIYRS
ncbi:MAG: DUF456 domain-containing protein [Akkermansiaceae bacterium]|nr:DUF456 domain-containing protein [Verrucomicrobiales bacterium]